MARADKAIRAMQKSLVDSGYYTSESALKEITKQALKKLSPQKVQELMNVDVRYEVLVRDFVTN